MSASATWVIPAITATSSLLGTAVGGFSTYWTSKKSFERSQMSGQAEQRNTQLREAAIRFITAITDLPVDQSGLARLTERFGLAATRMAEARTDEEFTVAAREFDPSIGPDADGVAVVMHLMRTTGVFDEEVQRAVALITELRLIAPRDVAESAQRVLYTAAGRDIAAAVSPNNQRHAADAFNREVNEFFNRVRHHMNVEDIEFDFFTRNEAR